MNKTKTNTNAQNQTLTSSAILILFLGIIPGLIHFLQSDTLLKLNGLGYLILVASTVFTIKGVEAFQEVAPKMLIVYALTTIGMYFVLMGDSALGHTLGLATKAIELLLVIMLLNWQRNRKQVRKVWMAQSTHHLMSRGESW